ncbi:hypothetical protein DFH06DRAFT_1128021 [Mycena polygramma]|nr:hypothetical protein DFH06DRAFT_1128021 [Mycena polygramma]
MLWSYCSFQWRAEGHRCNFSPVIRLARRTKEKNVALHVKVHPRTASDKCIGDKISKAPRRFTSHQDARRQLLKVTVQYSSQHRENKWEMGLPAIVNGINNGINTGITTGNPGMIGTLITVGADHNS